MKKRFSLGLIFLVSFLVISCASLLGKNEKEAIILPKPAEVATIKETDVGPPLEKGPCHLQILNHSKEKVSIRINSALLGHIEPGARAIYFRTLNCFGGRVTLETREIILDRVDLVSQNSDFEWYKSSSAGNIWTLTICPDMRVVESQKMCK